MTPLLIKMLLHYYTTPGDYADAVDEAHGTSNAVDDGMHWLVECGLLERNPVPNKQKWTITAKGIAMVDHLCAVQVPVCQWVQPARLP